MKHYSNINLEFTFEMKFCLGIYVPVEKENQSHILKRKLAVSPPLNIPTKIQSLGPIIIGYVKYSVI